MVRSLGAAGVPNRHEWSRGGRPAPLSSGIRLWRLKRNWSLIYTSLCLNRRP